MNVYKKCTNIFILILQLFNKLFQNKKVKNTYQKVNKICSRDNIHLHILVYLSIFKQKLFNFTIVITWILKCKLKKITIPSSYLITQSAL